MNRSLEEALIGALAHPRVALGVDFDGTLAPLVDHPDLAVPDPRALDAIRMLSEVERVDVVVVSGRSHSDLRERLGDIEGVLYIGEHGNDTGDIRQSKDGIVNEMVDLVEALAAKIPGAVTERKTRSATFHYRNVADEAAAPAVHRIRRWVRQHPGVGLIEGKKVLELTTTTLTKGDAVMELAGSDPVIYIGDDTTDETVFQMLRPGDVGVKVGEGDTAAEHRVEDVGGVVTILERILLASR